MAKVTVTYRTPAPPPINEVQIALSADEAISLHNLLSCGISVLTLKNLGLDVLLEALENQISDSYLDQTKFKTVAYKA